jgi:hypothetical protein
VSEADPVATVDLVRFAVVSGHGSEESLQTKLQTNHATQVGIGRYKPALSEEKWRTEADG